MHPHPDSAVNILPPVVHTITTYTYTHTWEVHEVHILPVVILLFTEKRCPIFPSYSYYFPLLTNNQYMRHLRYANIQLLTKIFLLGSASFNDSCLNQSLPLMVAKCQLSSASSLPICLVLGTLRQHPPFSPFICHYYQMYS